MKNSRGVNNNNNNYDNNIKKQKEEPILGSGSRAEKDMEYKGKDDAKNVDALVKAPLGLWERDW